MRLYSLSASRQDVNLEIFRSGEKIAAFGKEQRGEGCRLLSVAASFFLFRFNSLPPPNSVIHFLVHLMVAPPESVLSGA